MEALCESWVTQISCLGPPSDGPDRVWECEVEERPKGALQKQVYCKKKQFSSSIDTAEHPATWQKNAIVRK